MSGRGQRALLATSSRQAIAPEAREPPLRRRVGWIAPPPLRVRASYVGYVGAPRYAPGATRLPAPPGSPPPASPLSKAASGFSYSCDCIAVHMSSHEAVDVWCPCNRDDPGPSRGATPGSGAARGGFSAPPQCPRPPGPKVGAGRRSSQNSSHNRNSRRRAPRRLWTRSSPAPPLPNAPGVPIDRTSRGPGRAPNAVARRKGRSAGGLGFARSVAARASRRPPSHLPRP